MRRRALAQHKTRVVDDTQRVLRMVGEHDAVADVIEHGRRGDDRVFLRGVPRLLGIVALLPERQKKELVPH